MISGDLSPVSPGSLTEVNENVVHPTGSSNYPLRGAKGSLWEAGSRVPAFISGRNVPKGEVSQKIYTILCIHMMWGGQKSKPPRLH